MSDSIFGYFIFALILLLATGFCPFLWMPFLMRRLRKRDMKWSNLIAIVLVFAPGFITVEVWTIFWINFDDRLNRITYWKEHIGEPALGVLAAYWFFTGVQLVVWIIGERSLKKRNSVSTWPNTLLRRAVTMMMIISAVVTWYLATYKTLEDAVKEGDLRLTEKRLHFNLLGVDANNGYITKTTTIGTKLHSLLPLAAQTGNHRMVKLLIEHGADISGDGGERALAEAVQHGHQQVVRLLIEAGVDTHDNYYLRGAVGKHRAIAEYLAEKGYEVDMDSEKHQEP